MLRIAFAAALLTILEISIVPSVSAEESCGSEPGMCRIESGEYAIRLPQRSSKEPVPALIYFHGYGGSGNGALRNTGMVDAFVKRGYAVIAPNGLKRGGTGPSAWSFLPNRPEQRNELEFARDVLADASKRFGIDRNKVLMSGFSIGGSLTWYLACRDPGIARAFAPVGGAFWRPHPVAEDCNGPINLLHTHGWRDGTVPLEGRPLRGGALIQGDVFQGLQILRQINACRGLKATKFDTAGKFWRREWEKCAPGTTLEFALHEGGHSVPRGWAPMAIDWFEALPK